MQMTVVSSLNMISRLLSPLAVQPGSAPACIPYYFEKNTNGMNIKGKWKIEGKERNISAGPTHVSARATAEPSFHLLSMVNVELVDQSYGYR